jgi:hypothetical protein
MRAQDDHIEDNIYKIVTRADESFFNSGQGIGNWEFVDYTSLVMLALAHREPKNSPWLQMPKKWLLSKQESEDIESGSWNDEVFDTAIAIMALMKVGTSPTDPVIVQGLEYLQNIYHANGRPNWEDEPWETSWAILAIFESGDMGLAEEICHAVGWLRDLQDEDGCIISPHYTSYFVKIVSILKNKQDRMGICAREFQKFERSSASAVHYLVELMDEKILWTGEAWSNGQILWALASTDNFPFDDLHLTSMAVDWFMKNQGADGKWCENDDTACAVLGLVALLRGHISYHNKDTSSSEDVGTIIFNHFRRLYQPQKLLMGKKFVEVLDDGTTTLNFSPRMRKIVTIIFAIVSGLTVIVAAWEYLRDYIIP